MFKANTVAGALAPLSKVQSNLEAVSARRETSAKDRRSEANALVILAEADEVEQAQAAAILAKLNKLLSPTEG